MITVRYHLKEYTPDIHKRINELKDQAFMERLARKDATLWKEDPAVKKQIEGALGWLDVIPFSKEKIPEMEALTEELKEEGITDVLLIGMGGSSLAPLMFSKLFKKGEGNPTLRVIDSTDPHHIKDVTDSLEPATTLFIVASKSGTTLEVLTLFEHFYEVTRHKVGDTTAGRHFIAITDEGTPLTELARQRGFRKTFINPSDIGGRYSALSLFGLLPAALMGVDVARLLDEAQRMLDDCLGKGDQSPGLMLGAIMGELALKGRDKLTFVTTDGLGWFALWLEQLIAESTGKEGRGVVPIALEPPCSAYGRDRVFVSIGLSGNMPSTAGSIEDHPHVEIELGDIYAIGAEFIRWEVATACCGAVLGINPFDQPNVEETKSRTRKLLQEGITLPEAATETPLFQIYSNMEVEEFFKGIKEGWYVGLLAYIPPDREEFHRELDTLRRLFIDRLHVATQFGYGPRYLHSTGQLHKGGTKDAAFIILAHTPKVDIPIPHRDYTFGNLILSQAFADRESLEKRGRRVLFFNLKELSTEAIRRVADFIEEKI